MVKRIRQYIPIEPQPDDTNLVLVRRSYPKLKADHSYTRRITWIDQAPEKISHTKSVALWEYTGKYPDVPSLHGNAKTPDRPYGRCSQAVSDQVNQLNKCMAPKKVYNEMIDKSDDIAPMDIKQVQNKKYYQRRKERESQNKTVNYRSNFSDNVQVVET